VTGFLVARGEKLDYIHGCLFRSVGQTVDVHSVLWWVRWIKEAEIGGAELHDGRWSGCPCIAVTCDIRCVGKLVCGDCHVTNYASACPPAKAVWWQLLCSFMVLGSVLVGNHKYDIQKKRE
jgi:hypothetical protein